MAPVAPAEPANSQTPRTSRHRFRLPGPFCVALPDSAASSCVIKPSTHCEKALLCGGVGNIVRRQEKAISGQQQIQNVVGSGIKNPRVHRIARQQRAHA